MLFGEQKICSQKIFKEESVYPKMTVEAEYLDFSAKSPDMLVPVLSHSAFALLLLCFASPRCPSHYSLCRISLHSAQIGALALFFLCCDPCPWASVYSPVKWVKLLFKLLSSSNILGTFNEIACVMI